MTNSSKLKGDSAERECAQLIAELTGHPARRVVAEAFDTDPTPPHGIVRNHRKGPHT